MECYTSISVLALSHTVYIVQVVPSLCHSGMLHKSFSPGTITHSIHCTSSAFTPCHSGMLHGSNVRISLSAAALAAPIIVYNCRFSALIHNAYPPLPLHTFPTHGPHIFMTFLFFLCLTAPFFHPIKGT